MISESRLKLISEKITELKQVDPSCTLFGAANHRYITNQPLAEAEIQAFEQNAGIRLPGDYRAYINTVSNGGGGPFYGLYDLHKAVRESLYYYFEDDELDAADWQTKIDIAAKGDLKAYFKPFPILSEQVKELMRVNESYEDDEWQTIPLPERLYGFLLLCEYGCGGYYLLAVNGEQAGTVWFFQSEEYLNPCYTKGKQWSFYDFMEWWADDSLLQIKDPQARYKNEVNDPLQKMELIYDQQELTQIPDEVFACRNLRKLQFSRNKITALPDTLFELGQMRILNLEMNLFESLPDAIGNLKELRVLKLAYCSQLKSLPKTIGKLTQLKKLMLAYCSHLLQLPDEINGLVNLKLLHCYGSGLKMRPETLAELPALETVNIYADELELGPAFKILGGCKNLETVACKENAQMPAAVQHMKNIKSLIIQKNYAIETEHVLPDEIVSTNIERLYLEETMCLLPDSIGAMQSLKELHISTNQLLKLPAGIRLLKNLKFIRCSTLNDKIGADKEAAFREMFPNVEFRWW